MPNFWRRSNSSSRTPSIFRKRRPWSRLFRFSGAAIAETLRSDMRAAPAPLLPLPSFSRLEDAMTETHPIQTDAIRSLNDDFRRAFVGGAILITAGVEAQPT